MPRRRKNDDWVWAIPQVVGLFMALGFVFPPVRQVLIGLGFIVVSAIGVVVVGLIGFGVYRFIARSQRAQAVEHNIDWKALGVNVDGDKKQPQATADLVQQLRSIDWFQFEQLVALLYRKQGYAVNRRGGANPDGGIDLVIEKNGTRTAVQCKHWKSWNVGVKAVREFLGALTDAGIQHGLFITLGGCTGDAKRLADKHGIQVVNEAGLARMLEATDPRFDPAALEILRDDWKTCPKCEREMVLRTASKGPGAGNEFWGCSGYPRCRFTMPLSNGQPKATLAAVR